MAKIIGSNCTDNASDTVIGIVCNATEVFLENTSFSFDFSLSTTGFPEIKTNSKNGSSGMQRRPLGMYVEISVYVIIFLLAVVGNVLVIVTLIQNKKMRTVTNVFLLNLSISDLLLAMLCMPFTLIPTLIRNFIFGEAVCVMIRYLQAVSVGVSCFTLVAISMERYFAICRPLHSRSWQTLSHAYKSLAVCWMLAFFIMIPIAVYHKLIHRPNMYMCRERWDNKTWEKAYTMIINFILLIFPVCIMCLTYGMISYTLWIGVKLEEQSERGKQQKNGCMTECESGVHLHGNGRKGSFVTDSEYTSTAASSNRPFRRFEIHRAMRQSNSEKSRASKKRVIKMLFAVVLEFFICWTPTYVIMTWIVFHPKTAFSNISPTTKSLVHALSYVSACCNPITYCFMNRNFRQGFLSAFRCLKKRYVYARRNELSFSENTASTRTGASQVTSYDKIHESDDISEKSF